MLGAKSAVAASNRSAAVGAEPVQQPLIIPMYVSERTRRQCSIDLRRGLVILETYDNGVNHGFVYHGGGGYHG